MQKKWIAGLMAAVLVPAAVFAASASQNEVVYNAKNESVNGTYKEPVKEGAEFWGWATTKEKADAGQVDFKANPEDPSNSDLNKIGGSSTQTVYAVWRSYNAKWAVALYGIDQDLEKMGGGTYAHTMTFGPATSEKTGSDYVTKHNNAHIDSSAETDDDKCIHNHSWDEIIALCKTNPHVFDKCVKAGCTQTVMLTINDILKGEAWFGLYNGAHMPRESGDGVSVLYNELRDEFRVWQPGGDMPYNDSGDTTGGYPASRIRAVLNGYDWTSDSSHGKTTDLNRSNETHVEIRTDILSDPSVWHWTYRKLTDIRTITEENCLLSCFPKNLQAAIVPKAVKSDTVYNDLSGNNVTTWDKLWLFSEKEVLVDGYVGHATMRPNEGTLYERARVNESPFLNTAGFALNLEGEKNAALKEWHLRSLSVLDNYSAYSVSAGGSRFYGNLTGSSRSGIAPGFVIGK